MYWIYICLLLKHCLKLCLLIDLCFVDFIFRYMCFVCYDYVDYVIVLSYLTIGSYEPVISNSSFVFVLLVFIWKPGSVVTVLLEAVIVCSCVLLKFLSSAVLVINRYNDVPLIYDKAIYEQLRDADIDHLLAQHIAHLFIRDSVSLFSEKVNQDDEQDTDHFEVSRM